MLSIFPDVIDVNGQTSGLLANSNIKIKGSVKAWATNSMDFVAPTQPEAVLDPDAAGAIHLNLFLINSVLLSSSLALIM